MEKEEVMVEINKSEDQSANFYPQSESSNEDTDALEAEETESDGNKAQKHRRKSLPTRATNGKAYCGTCRKSFVTNGSLQLHMKIHLENKSFICKFCGRAFRRFHHLEAHTLSHQGLKPFVCDICGQCFSEKRGLKNHLAKHNGVKQIVCHLCEKRFWHTDGLRKHINKVHLGENRTKACGSKRSDPCEICGKTFSDNGSLARHMYIHTGEKEASCPICKKDFTRLSALYRHNRRRHNPRMAPKKRGGKRKKKPLIDGSGFIDSEKGKGKYANGKNVSESSCKSKRKNFCVVSEPAHREENDIEAEIGTTSAAGNEWPSSSSDKTRSAFILARFARIKAEHVLSDEWPADLARIKAERVLSEDEATIPYCESSDECDQYSPMLGTTVKTEAETETETGKVIGDKILTGSERVSVAVTVRPGFSPFVRVKNEPEDSDLETDEEDLEPMIEDFI